MAAHTAGVALAGRYREPKVEEPSFQWMTGGPDLLTSGLSFN
jgi:hypothetical protein